MKEEEIKKIKIEMLKEFIKELKEVNLCWICEKEIGEEFVKICIDCYFNKIMFKD